MRANHVVFAGLILIAVIGLTGCGGSDADGAKAMVQTLLDAMMAGDSARANAQILPSELAGNEFKFTPEQNPIGKVKMWTTLVVPDNAGVTVYVKNTAEINGKTDSWDVPYVCVKENGRWYVSLSRTAKLQGLPWPPK